MGPMHEVLREFIANRCSRRPEMVGYAVSSSGATQHRW
jgi:hypothetical protein